MGMATRWVSTTLIVLVVLVQLDFWFSRNGVFHVRGLRQQLEALQGQAESARQRNARVQAEVLDLREGLEMVEDKARSELGMIKPDEIFVHVSRGR